MTLNLTSYVSEVPGIGEKTAKKLAQSEIISVQNLLEHYPKTHRIIKFSTINSVNPGDYYSVSGNISSVISKKTNRLSIQSATLSDSTGKIKLTWFNQPYLAKSIQPGSIYTVTGKIENFRGLNQIVNPKLEKTSKSETRLEPIYSQSGDLNSRWFATHIKKLLDYLPKIRESIPETIKEKYGLLEELTAYNQIHFPIDYEYFEKALYTLSFKELYKLQYKTLKSKEQKKVLTNKIKIDKPQIKEFTNSLPFSLTTSQTNSINEILRDLNKPYAMRRLLLGDVGSGKTAVAAAASYAVLKASQKVLFLAPTQLLAEQLYSTLTNFLVEYNIQLLTGKTKQTGDYDVLVGTHAILNQNLNEYKNISLVVIDEQHKFGVTQRNKLLNLSPSPHLLMMSATPIPRSLALTILSDTDISHLSEKPANRLEIKTFMVKEEKRSDAYSWIEKQINNGNKVFVVAPLIEESDSDILKHLKSAKDLFEEYKRHIKSAKVALLHGNLSEEEKIKIIHEFKSGKYNLLTSTTVVEVGIDIPNANIMIIESAERFGLSQLHQLRGRVGRSNIQSYCLLFTSSESLKSNKRLDYFVKHNDGAKLAELDMELRGPGELWGTEQHGFFNLKLANIFDKELIKQTHDAAKSTLAKHTSAG